MSSLEATDAAAEAVRTGHRITLDDLRARVDHVDYAQHEHLTVCVIRLDNGYYLVGKSVPVDPSNFNADYGRQAAHDDALRQAWALVAFAQLEHQTA